MLVCLHPGLFFFFFFDSTCLVTDFFSYLDGENTVNTYLLNLIFELFTLLHFMCLVLLECACYHFEFSLLKSTQWLPRASHKVGVLASFMLLINYLVQTYLMNSIKLLTIMTQHGHRNYDHDDTTIF